MPDFTFLFTAKGRYPHPNPPVEAIRESIIRHMEAYGFKDVELQSSVIPREKAGEVGG